MDILAATMAEEALVVLLVGAIVIVSMSLKALLGKAGLPVMIGYIFIGMAIRGFDSYKPVLDEHGEVFLFLAELGVICLLFRIGMDSNLHKLLSKLGKATFIGLFCVAVSGLAAYYACRFILGMDLITSLIVGTAMTATSVGIPAQVWERAGKVGSDEGQLLLDVAELDDIVGVVLMGLLFAMLPRITGPDEQAFAGVLTKTAGIFALKLVAFGAFCFLFGMFCEKRVRKLVQRLEKPPEPTLTVVAIGVIIAAIAGLLGFSVAIGAFFAGLVFSRDPQSVKEKKGFDLIFDFFVPFFFVGIGIDMQLQSVAPAIFPAIVLFAVAFAGKFLGSFAPTILLESSTASLLLGFSMVPRAEIALIISQRSLELGQDTMPGHIYSAIVLTCIGTCIVAPIILKKLIPKWVK